MFEPPPKELVALLERLGLAAAEQVARMGRRASRLAGDLPQFDSVWLDALAQARILTPFQVAELNAGRGQSLRLGPFVLCERLPCPYYVPTYRAKNVDSSETVRLAVIENLGPRADAILGQLEALVGCVLARTRKDADLRACKHAPYRLTHAGSEGRRLFAAASWIDGRSAAEWMVHHGRFPPEVVLEIARAMAAQLVELETGGICHGDVSVASLLLTDAGEATLILPGLRGILRPEEGYAHADLLPEAFDSLSPERIAAGTPPNAASDIFACGCTWWQMLCGRPPLVGGTSLAKLRAAQAGEICDLRRHAPDAPATLAAAISACVEREPSRRPDSLARLAAMLGSPTRSGREAVADCLERAGRPTIRWTTTVRKVRRSSHTPLWLAGAACLLAAMLAVFWPVFGGRRAEVGAKPQAAFITHPAPHPLSITFRLSPLASHPSPVVPAAYQQPVQAAEDLVLVADKPQRLASLELRAGQCVRAPEGRRATVLVPIGGLAIDEESVRFENIDFLWDHAAGVDSTKCEQPAVVQLRASRATFRGCSFRCSDGQKPNGPDRGLLAPGYFAVSAIRWTHPGRTDEPETSLPSGRIELTDCLLCRVEAGIDCHTIGALGIELTNTLCLHTGPAVRLDHCPQPDEPVSLGVSQVTLRGGGPLLECRLPRREDQPGEIAILATACVFAPAPGEPLVQFSGTAMPERWIGSLRWTGQGSLVVPGAPISTWRGTDGRSQAVDESSLSIAGLVRSEVRFAGQPSSDPAASRILDWQAPLQSANPPGFTLDLMPNSHP